MMSFSRAHKISAVKKYKRIQMYFKAFSSLGVCVCVLGGGCYIFCLSVTLSSLLYPEDVLPYTLFIHYPVYLVKLHTLCWLLLRKSTVTAITALIATQKQVALWLTAPKLRPCVSVFSTKTDISIHRIRKLLSLLKDVWPILLIVAIYPVFLQTCKNNVTVNLSFIFPPDPLMFKANSWF